jgi:hypothetical protein
MAGGHGVKVLEGKAGGQGFCPPRAKRNGLQREGYSILGQWL